MGGQGAWSIAKRTTTRTYFHEGSAGGVYRLSDRNKLDRDRSSAYRAFESVEKSEREKSNPHHCVLRCLRRLLPDVQRELLDVSRQHTELYSHEVAAFSSLFLLFLLPSPCRNLNLNLEPPGASQGHVYLHSTLSTPSQLLPPSPSPSRPPPTSSANMRLSLLAVLSLALVTSPVLSRTTRSARNLVAAPVDRRAVEDCRNSAVKASATYSASGSTGASEVRLRISNGGGAILPVNYPCRGLLSVFSVETSLQPVNPASSAL